MRGIWDPNKDLANRRKHGLGFAAAMRVFADPFALSELERIVDGEERWQTIGLIDGVAVIVVAHSYREDAGGEEIVRMISARGATGHERKRYETERRRHL